jgi:hypothetical protein
MNIEKTFQGIRITDIINNKYINEYYIGYSLTEAKTLFKKRIKQIKENK